ncbi:MAG: CinA family protein [Candidatus Bipolaricaulia bacterium]
MREIARQLGARLRETGRTISVAESCTAGGLAHEITRVPGASAYFLGGVIAYDDAVKISLLDIPRSDLQRFGAVSAETAEAMATACRSLFGTDTAVSITGIAGPGGGTDEKPVGLVFIAVAGERGVRCHRFEFPGNRDDVRAQAIDAALKESLNLLDETGEAVRA